MREREEPALMARRQGASKTLNGRSMSAATEAANQDHFPARTSNTYPADSETMDNFARIGSGKALHCFEEATRNSCR